MTHAEALKDLRKVGEARLEVLFWDVYDSSLYSADGRYDPQQYPIALNIQYLRNIKAKDLIEKTASEWQKLGFDNPSASHWLDAIQDLWPDISKGDELLLVVDDDKTSYFYHNGEALGQISDPQFGPQFLAIWLDEKCSYPKLRKQLIGLNQ
jgi:hypothetical protein